MSLAFKRKVVHIGVEGMMQEVDPCDDLTDEDIRTAIQNASGPKNVLFVPEVQLGMVLFFSHCTL